MAEATTQTPPVINSGRLKYADPRSLPSYPSTGLRPDGAAAGAAATLGWHNQKTIELWKPDKISSASAAAVLAKDYKMAPQWEPSPNSAGHKAALLAVGSATSALKHQASVPAPKSPHEGWGNSAATQAFHANRVASEQKNDLSHGGSAATQAFIANRSQSARSVHEETAPAMGDRPLLAAKGAMSSTLQRAHSTASATSRHEGRTHANAASNALNGATTAHRASMVIKSTPRDAGAVPVTTMTRNMFTSHPMVKPEVDEKMNNERLHQSAVEMAKKMYNAQQKMLDQAKDVDGDGTAKAQPPAYLNLQDAAYKQAQERLAKLHDEHQKNREYQEYYGSTTKTPKRRFTVTNRLRRRNSDEDFDDQAESLKIRQQMSMFSNKLSEVDQTKRQQDRDALLAAAQRNVKARLHGMDEKVYQDTGKVNPTLLSDWEVKAQQAAQSRSVTRNENKGKIDLGGGMFMDPDEVDAIASKRMQPVMDDINTKAEAERERLAAIKLAEESRREEAEKQRARDREMKDLNKRIRDEEKQDQRAKRLQEKEEEKVRKEQEKAEKAEQKRLAKQGNRRSKHDSAHSGVGAIDNDDEHSAAMNNGVAPIEPEDHQDAGLSQNVPGVETTVAADPNYVHVHGSETEHARTSDVESPSSPTSKVKGWIKNRFSRSKSVHENETVGEQEKKRRSFFRGGTLKKTHPNDSTHSLEHRTSSMRDVAMAGRSGEEESHGREGAQASGARDSRGVSPVSSVEDRRSRSVYRDEEDGVFSMAPPRPIADPAPRSSLSPNRDSRFREEMDV
jgi:hypothetical protein